MRHCMHSMLASCCCLFSSPIRLGRVVVPVVGTGECERHPGQLPSSRASGASPVIPSERSESRDLHFKCVDSRGAGIKNEGVLADETDWADAGATATATTTSFGVCRIESLVAPLQKPSARVRCILD